ncbi:transcriptional regulator [Exiguobacterium sp. SH1S21]|uniref:helix-turn-helix transcriptional regulator n=1 Tax=unclassified Exiguobacterium TaxID=2644629 RepID=UPI00103F989E|nr:MULTISPECIES: helix-turn-helix transcriptional regulator [unclassified Exiguobacterium]TCI51985.1 transcriptional regulator [Exiguobacterium sp. SH1S21]TCI69119.1 transcriptional regulator [Exiguobacterium sp. SH0S7]
MVRKEQGHLQNRLSVLRAERKWSQKQVAEMLGVSRQTIVSLENNRYSPSLKLAFEIASLFETTLHDVFQYEMKENEE